MHIKPLGKNVLIKPLTEKETKSGILLPASAKEKPRKAK